jgi:hypothetical protein
MLYMFETSAGLEKGFLTNGSYFPNEIKLSVAPSSITTTTTTTTTSRS